MQKLSGCREIQLKAFADEMQRITLMLLLQNPILTAAESVGKRLFRYRGENSESSAQKSAVKNGGTLTLRKSGREPFTHSLVRSVVTYSPHTAIAIESIVLTGVISVIGLEVMRMKRNEINYYISLSIVKSMLNQGVVSEQSYHEIVTNLIEKYRPVSAVLLSEKPLT